MASAIESGSADSLSNTAIFCSWPSSSSRKLSLVRPPIGDPFASVTVTKTLTSFTSATKVVAGSDCCSELCPGLSDPDFAGFDLAGVCWEVCCVELCWEDDCCAQALPHREKRQR